MIVLERGIGTQFSQKSIVRNQHNSGKKEDRITQWLKIKC